MEKRLRAWHYLRLWKMNFWHYWKFQDSKCEYNMIAHLLTLVDKYHTFLTSIIRTNGLEGEVQLFGQLGHPT